MTYVVVQEPANKAWKHYLCAWYGDVPGWGSRRSAAMTFDEPTALQLVGRFDKRYRCPASGLRHHVEDLEELS